MGAGSGPSFFAGFCWLFFFMTRIGGPGKGTVKGGLKALVDLAGGTFLVPTPRLGTWEAWTCGWQNNAASVRRMSCVGIATASGSAWFVISRL